MKRIIIAFAIFSLILTGTASAMVSDQCSVEKLEVENIATEITTKAKMTYYFECRPSSAYDGQVTKMVVTIPYRDVYNVEASDGLGDMKVFEGPAYAAATRSDTDATVGSFFRKSLLIKNDTTKYMLTIEFQSDLLVTEAEKVYTITPKGLGANPKVTIITSGITETVLPVGNIDYKLTLPTGSAVVSSPSGCSLSEGVVTCDGMVASGLDKVEVKWTGSGPGLLSTKIRDAVNKYMPDTFANIFKNLLGIFKK